MSNDLKIFVGYDSREDIAWQVCRHSLLRHATTQLNIFPLKLKSLQELGLYTRSDDNSSTEFSLTRFLTPYIAAHDGWCIFVDCDFLFTSNIRNVIDIADPSKAVHVVKHDYTPKNAFKMDGKRQSSYPRKNWSSFILFNNSHSSIKKLTPDVVNSAEPAFLHRFHWLDSDDEIGELPVTWNFLEGEYQKPDIIPNAVHYTNGGPWFEQWQNVDFAAEWNAEKALYENSVSTTK